MTSSTKRLITSVLLTIVILCFGTAGYMIIEGWDTLIAVGEDTNLQKLAQILDPQVGD